MLKRDSGVTTRNQHEAKGFLFDEAAGKEYDPKQRHLMPARPPEVAGDNEMGMPGGVVLVPPALGGM